MYQNFQLLENKIAAFEITCDEVMSDAVVVVEHNLKNHELTQLTLPKLVWIGNNFCRENLVWGGAAVYANAN